MNDFCASINTGITAAAPHPLIKAPVVSSTATRWQDSHACISNHPLQSLFKKARGKNKQANKQPKPKHQKPKST